MTNRELDAESIGEQLGVEGVGSVVAKVEAYCTYEEQRIELTNQPRILALRQEGSLLLEEERDLTECLRHAPPPGSLRSRQRRNAYYWGITIILTVAAFVFSLLTFDPFRTGWKGYLYCLGIAVVTPFLLEQFLEKWNGDRLFKLISGSACAAALTSLVFLAVIRGDLFAEQMKNTAPVIVFDDAQPETQPPAQNTFYDTTIVLLRLVMALLALAMEFGAGLALHQAWRMGSNSTDDWEKPRARLGEVHQRMMAITEEITTLQNDAAVFASRFWRNFYRAMLTHSVRSAMTKLFGVALTVFVIAHGRAIAQGHLTEVIAVDLTQSVAVTGPDHTTEFQKNIDAITKLLSQVPADSSVTVIGITDRSFAQPYILLSATIPSDAGYFGERLTSARRELVRVWKTRSTSLKPEFRQTDILGALLVASQIFKRQNSAGRKKLVIFSDMRHRTSDMDLETYPITQRLPHAGKGDRTVPVDLDGVYVYALGVDGAERPIRYWEILRQFWTDYFRADGANLESYSVLREP